MVVGRVSTRGHRTGQEGLRSRFRYGSRIPRLGHGGSCGRD